MRTEKSYQAPEEQELNAKKSELAELENLLADRELEMVSLEAELEAFEKEYFRLVVTKFLELDELLAQIADAEARAKPNSKKAKANAEEARVKAEETRQNISDAPPTTAKTPEFNPSENMKKMYRKAAKILHPDLTTDEAEHERRTRAMAEANQAYAEGDEARLESILRNWYSNPDSVQGEGVVTELIRTIRKVAQVRQRLNIIQEQLQYLQATDIFQLFTAAQSAKEKGQDLLADMVIHLGEQISEASDQLQGMKG